MATFHTDLFGCATGSRGFADHPLVAIGVFFTTGFGCANISTVAIFAERVPFTINLIPLVVFICTVIDVSAGSHGKAGTHNRWRATLHKSKCAIKALRTTGLDIFATILTFLGDFLVVSAHPWTRAGHTINRFASFAIGTITIFAAAIYTDLLWSATRSF